MSAAFVGAEMDKAFVAAETARATLKTVSPSRNFTTEMEIFNSRTDGGL